MLRYLFLILFAAKIFGFFAGSWLIVFFPVVLYFLMFIAILLISLIAAIWED